MLNVMLTDQSLSAAVRRTLAYAKAFEFPPSRRYVWRFLSSRRIVSPNKLRNISTYYRLPDRLANSTIECQKWRSVAAAVNLIALVPWVRSIWVTGALAAGVALAEDDLDFMIITDPSRLWLSRALVVGVGLLTGRYRTHWLSLTRTANRWCCNLWLEPSALALPPNRRTLYEARELIQAVPVYRRPGERATLLLERNSWARDYLANGYRWAFRRANRLSPQAAVIGVTVPTWMFNWFNRWLFALQRRYMERRMTRETVQPDRAFFHPRDTRSWVRRRYETICASQGLQPWFNEPAP